MSRTRAIREALRKLPPERVLEFVRAHPDASVKEFAKEFLAGIPVYKGGAAYAGSTAVSWRLQLARRKLGLTRRQDRIGPSDP